METKKMNKMCIIKFDESINKDSIKKLPETMPITFGIGFERRVVGIAKNLIIEDDGIYCEAEYNINYEAVIEKDKSTFLIGLSIGY